MSCSISSISLPMYLYNTVRFRNKVNVLVIIDEAKSLPIYRLETCYESDIWCCGWIWNKIFRNINFVSFYLYFHFHLSLSSLCMTLYRGNISNIVTKIFTPTVLSPIWHLLSQAKPMVLYCPCFGGSWRNLGRFLPTVCCVSSVDRRY